MPCIQSFMSLLKRTHSIKVRVRIYNSYTIKHAKNGVCNMTIQRHVFTNRFHICSASVRPAAIVFAGDFLRLWST